MMRTGKDYLESLRDGRQVYLGKEKVTDITTHKAFANTARTFARVYDLKRSPEFIDTCSFEENGERHSAWFLMPRSKEDLQKRADIHRLTAEWTHGLMGRSPDHVASYLTGMCMQPEIFQDKPGVSLERLRAIYEDMKQRDLFTCYLVLSPQSSRQPSPDGKKYPSLRVVAEDDKGVIVSGMKMLGTSAVFSDEALVGCMMPLGPGQEDEAISFTMPMNTPGTKIFVRKSFERMAENKIDAYFSSQFDETDAVMTFDNVHIPWERVFVYRNLAVTREMYYNTPAHIMGNHQSNWRFLAKYRLLNGIAHKAADMAGLLQIPAVQQTLGNLAAGESGIAAQISAQIHDFETLPSGYVHINRRYLYSTLHWCANNYYLLAEEVRVLLGSNPFIMPADASILENSEVSDLFEENWRTPGASASERYLFNRMAWDLVGSEYASRHTQYERFYGGPPHVMNMYNFTNYPWQERQAIVKNILGDMALHLAQTTTTPSPTPAEERINEHA